MATDQSKTAGEGGNGRRLRRLDLSHLTLLFVALAAAAGWAASFIGLHDFGVVQMIGFTVVTAWFIPAAFDGAAFACAVLTYRASIVGRSALRGRLLTFAFTAISAWIQWIHQPEGWARHVAVWLPIAAVAVFDAVLVDLRAEYEERNGRKAFRLRTWLLLLRWFVDREGTKAAFTDEVRKIQVSHLIGLGRETETPTSLTPLAPPVAATAPAPPPEAADEIEPATSTPVNVVGIEQHTGYDERPEWVVEGMTAREAMFAYLDRHPTANGRELDEFGAKFFSTKPDYGRGVRRAWNELRSTRPLAVNEG